MASSSPLLRSSPTGKKESDRAAAASIHSTKAGLVVSFVAFAAVLIAACCCLYAEVIFKKPNTLPDQAVTTPGSIQLHASRPALDGRAVADLPAQTSISRQPSSAARGYPQEKTIDQAAQQRQYEQRYTSKLDALMSRQDRDSKWSGENERNIERAMVELKWPGQLEQVRCAHTLCRVVFKHYEDADQRAFAFADAKVEPFMAGTQFSYDGLSTTMYLARTGYPLPDHDE